MVLSVVAILSSLRSRDVRFLRDFQEPTVSGSQRTRGRKRCVEASGLWRRRDSALFRWRGGAGLTPSVLFGDGTRWSEAGEDFRHLEDVIALGPDRSGD